MIPRSGTPPVAGNPTYYAEDLLGTSRVLTTNLPPSSAHGIIRHSKLLT